MYLEKLREFNKKKESSLPVTVVIVIGIRVVFINFEVVTLVLVCIGDLALVTALVATKKGEAFK